MKPLPWTVSEILKATGGELLSGDISGKFSGISIDSRKIEADDLFVAIKGEHHDGHDFIESVCRSGVRGILIQKEKTGILSVKALNDKDCVCVAVEDTVKALGALAGFRKNQTGVKTVGITGSNGKTTTKEMVTGILSGAFEVLSTQGNLNNEIGLPLTLFQLKPFHQWAVLEMGMNHPGEISRLAQICNPDIGVITNVGPSHLEGLGSIEDVARAKGELLENMNRNGAAVLNGDDPFVMGLAKTAPVSVCLYGQENPEAAVRAQSIEDKGDTLLFDLVLPNGKVPVKLKLAGRYMISNALAAAGVGYLAGLFPEDIKKGLELFKPVKRRMNLFETDAGVNLVDDTYNANPCSTEAAIRALANLRKNRPSALVLGDMLELGSYAPSLHRQIGEIAYQNGIERLFLTGEYAADVRSGAVAKGMLPSHIMMGTKKEIVAALQQWMKPGDWILVKGSRSMKMETIVLELLNPNEPMQDLT